MDRVQTTIFSWFATFFHYYYYIACVAQWRMVGGNMVCKSEAFVILISC